MRTVTLLAVLPFLIILSVTAAFAAPRVANSAGQSDRVANASSVASTTAAITWDGRRFQSLGALRVSVTRKGVKWSRFLAKHPSISSRLPYVAWNNKRFYDQASLIKEFGGRRDVYQQWAKTHRGSAALLAGRILTAEASSPTIPAPAPTPTPARSRRRCRLLRPRAPRGQGRRLRPPLLRRVFRFLLWSLARARLRLWFRRCRLARARLRLWFRRCRLVRLGVLWWRSRGHR